MRVKGKRVLKNGMEAGYVYYSKEKKWKWRIIGKAKKSKRVQKGGTHANFGMLFRDNVLKIRSNTFKNIKKSVQYKDKTNIYKGIIPIIEKFIRLYSTRRGLINHFEKCRGNDLKSFQGTSENYRCWAAKFAYIIHNINLISSLLNTNILDVKMEISIKIHMNNIKKYFKDDEIIKENILDYMHQNSNKLTNSNTYLTKLKLKTNKFENIFNTYLKTNKSILKV